jgi:hypothetical protein
MPTIRIELTQDCDLEQMTTIAQEIQDKHKELIKDIKLSP